MDERLKILMKQLEGMNTIQSRQTKEMFELHNHYFPNNPEFGQKCPTCRNRVYNRLKTIYEQIKNG